MENPYISRAFFYWSYLGIDLFYCVINKAAELEELFPHGHDSIKHLSRLPKYCPFVVFYTSPYALPHLQILGEEGFTFVEIGNIFVFLWPAFEEHPNIETNFCFSLMHHVTNIVHNYKNHDLPRSNVFTVDLNLREERQMIANNQLCYVDIEIEPERETAHIMELGTDGSITFPRLDDQEVHCLKGILGCFQVGMEHPRMSIEQAMPLIMDADELRVPLSITLG